MFYVIQAGVCGEEYAGVCKRIVIALGSEL